MSSLVAFLAYGLAVALAFYLNSGSHRLRWYWHLGSVVCALGLGFTHFPPDWAGPAFDIAIGSAFVLLFTFGLVGLITRVFVAHEEDRHARHHHA
jgi:hypothetical protein